PHLTVPQQSGVWTSQLPGSVLPCEIHQTLSLVPGFCFFRAAATRSIYGVGRDARALRAAPAEAGAAGPTSKPTIASASASARQPTRPTPKSPMTSIVSPGG